MKLALLVTLILLASISTSPPDSSMLAASTATVRPVMLTSSCAEMVTPWVIACRVTPVPPVMIASVAALMLKLPKDVTLMSLFELDVNLTPEAPETSTTDCAEIVTLPCVLSIPTDWAPLTVTASFEAVMLILLVAASEMFSAAVNCTPASPAMLTV